MGLFDIFKSKKVETLESKVNDLEEQLQANSDMSKSLIGFNNGKTYYFNTGNNDSYADHYTIYRGIDMLASLGAGLPVDIYKGDTLIPEKTLSPLGFDLTSPNPFMSFTQLQHIALTYFFYRGEYFVEIIEEPFFHLMPINPTTMTKTNNGTWQYDNGAERRIISPDNLIYAQLFNPDGGIQGRGLGPVDVVKADLQNEKSSIDYNTSWFRNKGNVGGWFYDKDGKARPEDMELITKQYEATKTGTGNTGKVIGLPRGIRYEDFQQTMVEMQYLESRKDIRDRILAVLGIHKALFGITDQVNRSVSEEATRMLWLHNLQPRMIRIQDAWQRQLFRPNFPLYTYKYDFNSIPELKQSVETINTQAKLLKFLSYTTNEINQHLKLGMEDIDDPALDVRTLPNNLIPFDEYVYDEDEQATANDNTEKATELLSEYFTNDQVKELKANSRRNKRIFVRDINRVRRKSERMMAGKLGKFFAKELGMIIKIVLGDQSADSSLDANLILAKIMNVINGNKVKLIKTMTPLYSDTSLSADGVAITMVSSAKDAIVAEEIVEALANKIVNVSNYTYKLVSKQVRDGINAGETIDQIANRVKSVYKFQSSRARVIARTETLKIIEGTTDKRYRDSGVEMKAWLSTGGGHSREEHSANADQGPIPYDQVFQNGQMTPADGSASQIINCRCTLIPVINEE